MKMIIINNPNNIAFLPESIESLPSDGPIVRSSTISTGAGNYYFDDTIDLSDMGYLYRNDFLMLAGRTQFKNTDLPSDSLSRERNYVLNYVFMTDTDGNKNKFSKKLFAVKE